jgi:hypothetical protein
METGEFLAARGHSVIILDLLPWEEICKGYPRSEVVYHEMQRNALGIEFHGPVEIESISDSCVTYRENGWRRSILGVDTVILATGAKPCTDLSSELEGSKIPFIRVGDCSNIGKIIDAIHSGADVALSL